MGVLTTIPCSESLGGLHAENAHAARTRGSPFAARHRASISANLLAIIRASSPSPKAPGVCLPAAWAPRWNSGEWQARAALRRRPVRAVVSGGHFGEETLWKPGHRGKPCLLSRAERPAVDVQREPGLIALIMQSCNSSCQHEGGRTVPILAAEHGPCSPRRDICTPVVIKAPSRALAIKSAWLRFNKR